MNNVDQEFKILAIDGGGIRGAFPAAYLDYIESQTGKPVYQYFDLIVGTSTGGIVSLALGFGVPAKEILNLYCEKGKDIFSKRSLRWFQNGYLLSKYRNNTLIREVKAVFGDKTLEEAKCRVCIPSIDLACGKNRVFKTRHSDDYFHDYKIPAWQFAIATASAPTYFPAFSDPDNCYFADGGFWANNPSLVGISEAIKLGYNSNCIKLLSIGTGNYPFQISKKRARLGLVFWGSKLVHLAFNSQTEAACNMAKYFLKNRYKRIDCPLAKEIKLDGTSGINELISKAQSEGKSSYKEVEKMFLQSLTTPFNQEDTYDFKTVI